jgi:phytoene dehydrogenase-like protein
MAEHYDVCVLGGQPAGFLVAALLAKRKLRTVLIDHGEGFDLYKQGGVLYPLMPQPLVGLRGFRPADRLLEELGAQVDLPRRYIESKPALQAVFARHRMDFDGTNDEIVREARREFGDDASRMQAALAAVDATASEVEATLDAEKTLPLTGWWGRFLQSRRLSGKSASLRSSASQSGLFGGLDPLHPLGETLVEAARFATHLDSDDLPRSVLSMLSQRALSGSVRLDGGGGSYLDVLAGLVTQAGGTVKRATLVSELSSDPKRLTGVETGGASRFGLKADFFISALYSHVLWQNLPKSRALSRFIEENAQLRVRSKMYFHHLLVKEEGLPVALGDNLLLMNGRRTRREGLEADSAVWVTVRKGHTKDHALISAAIEVKDSEASSLPEELATQRKRVRKQLERLMPFLSPFVVAESSPMAQSDWDVEEQGARKLDPWQLHPRYEPMPDAWLGVSGLPFHTPFKNLFRVGRETLPGLGALGDFVSARMAAEAILSLVKR